MPQLMPFYWVLSSFVVIFMLLVCYKLYDLKNNKILSFMNDKKLKIYWLW